MFGHVEDSPRRWASHLLSIRDAAAAANAAAATSDGDGVGRGGHRRRGRITEFVPLPFVHMQAPVYLKGGARRGPTLRECVLLHAVARLALHPHVTNIQASW
ncbi:hypothetical protein MNEG_14496 [Monoraphidium neglectum]|uniref:Uncharacterized protein n=1 Tax=Monoraphidium neglectum TaxID=145388 RepID=A0A0D2J056_9CHLO|nr:hypothetical protein MNEG_14496 [Monoraphidium neglectum]KIY93467.1 hypothetical protein MNEG_14496 [Monoraphidium neglectum]|eukprot:XP_013892487.1 hypothetical protein MNEG_14496 [Monoraphidium neglectum]